MDNLLTIVFEAHHPEKNHHRRYQEHQAHQDAAEWLDLGEHGLDKLVDQASERQAGRQLALQDEATEHPASPWLAAFVAAAAVLKYQRAAEQSDALQVALRAVA